MRKLSLFSVAALMVAATAACSPSDPTPSADGSGLRVDVVAPREPEIASDGGQLAVGDLADGYNHEETMARAMELDAQSQDHGTSWDDDGWVYSEGTGPAVEPPVDAIATKDNKPVKTTKVPADFEG